MLLQTTLLPSDHREPRNGQGLEMTTRERWESKLKKKNGLKLHQPEQREMWERQTNCLHAHQKKYKRFLQLRE